MTHFPCAWCAEKLISFLLYFMIKFWPFLAVDTKFTFPSDNVTLSTVVIALISLA